MVSMRFTPFRWNYPHQVQSVSALADSQPPSGGGSAVYCRAGSSIDGHASRRNVQGASRRWASVTARNRETPIADKRAISAKRRGVSN